MKLRLRVLAELAVNPLELQKDVYKPSLVKEPSCSRKPTGKALKPLLLFKLWSLPTAPVFAELFHPVVDAIALANLFSVVVPS